MLQVMQYGLSKVRSKLEIDATQVTRDSDALADWAYTSCFEAA